MRIISGILSGRRLEAPRGSGTRPTSDRVREALFMALEPLTGLGVVDLFAGSGALGIEALSRGAARADFVDSDRTARRALEANLDRLGLRDRAAVWPLELPRGLERLAPVLKAADLVLLDPPYGGGRARRTSGGAGSGPVGEPGLARETLEALGAPAVLRPGTRVVAEHHWKDPLPERAGALRQQRERRYGETVVTTYEVAPESPPEAAGGMRP